MELNDWRRSKYKQRRSAGK